MRQFMFETTSEAYLGILAALLDEPEFYPFPRGLPCQEITDCVFTVQQPSSKSIITQSESRNKLMSRYLASELSLYMKGERLASKWAREASSFWGQLANPDGTINSNYGWLLFMNRSLPDRLTPWEWARRSLLDDKDTRQAFARLALPEHQIKGTKDQPCTMHIMFTARDSRLNMTTVMRSNDVVYGLAYDMPWFCLLLDMMASEVGITKGTYTHFVHSMHLYAKDISKALEMLGRPYAATH